MSIYICSIFYCNRSFVWMQAMFIKFLLQMHFNILIKTIKTHELAKGESGSSFTTAFKKVRMEIKSVLLI